ncbi:MAG: hypothetical protein AVO38_14730 [delta proteobacterium ML8_D]|nr:MAG: hypothetical protein AVO38_14730 [delta proteobacterium ML8_D]
MYRNIDIPGNLFIAVFIVLSIILMPNEGITDNGQVIKPATPVTAAETVTEQARELLNPQPQRAVNLNSPVIQGWGKAPISRELHEWLKAHNVPMVVFVTSTGQAMVSNLSGQEVPCCGNIVGTEIEGNCTCLESATIENLSQDFTMVTSSSPGCVTKCFMGMCFQVDAETGRFPCN